MAQTMKSMSLPWMLAASLASVLLLNGLMAFAQDSESKDLPILLKWSGDYPVSELHRLPKGQRESRVGYIADLETFMAVWRAFKPGEKVPEVAFRQDLVIFSRNVDFYNRMSIGKVTLKDGIAEVLVIETMSALPIEDKVAMALAVIPRAGVHFIRSGNGMISVATERSATSPLNATYEVDGQAIKLLDGRREVQAAPGSVTRITTFVFGRPVFGDLDGDGDDDAALFLVQQPGGSGTFYYVAAALKLKGAYQGTNAVFLGDRIAPQTLRISNGVIIADYADRREGEPMATSPSVGKSMYLTIRKGVLEEIK